jgi:hypothetical protein
MLNIQRKWVNMGKIIIRLTLNTLTLSESLQSTDSGESTRHVFLMVAAASGWFTSEIWRCSARAHAHTRMKIYVIWRRLQNEITAPNAVCKTALSSLGAGLLSFWTSETSL